MSAATVIPINKAENPASSTKPTADLIHSLSRFRAELLEFVRGKETIVDAMVCAILSSGHALIEDVPGVGKTTIIKAIARLLGLEMRRIQCTSDLLPSDIIGVEVFSHARQAFEFHKGPLFANIVLADELNRASPRTQSALLEAMGEGFVTVDRQTYELPRPFILFAAQNPSDHVGTYPLPESQLDRFSVKIRLDYPSSDKERDIFRQSALDPISSLKEASLPRETLAGLQQSVEAVHISDRVAAYAQRFIAATRRHEALKRGVSTRGGVIWLRVSRARALLNQRDYVTPDDLLAMAPLCLSHRIVPHTGNDPRQVLEGLLNTVDIES